jgi:DNA-binding NarL/FixJ family response regulator
VPHAKKPISIVLVNENPLLGGRVLSRIRAQPSFHVLAASAEIEEALRQVREIKPDIVLLNLTQEGDDSLTLAGALHGDVPESRVIIMGLEAQKEDLASFIRAGVSGFIMAGSSFATIVDTIRAVAQGIQVLPSALTRALFIQLKRRGVRNHPKPTLEGERLTTPERAVAGLMVKGLSNKEIALRLRLTPQTVNNHVHKVLSKLTVNSLLEVAPFSQGGAALPRVLRAPRTGSMALA